MQTASTFTLIIIYVVLFVLELSNRDPAATYHTYESDSARVLVAVRIVLLIWFVWCVRRSAMNEEGPGVARFFKQFGVVGAVWLVSLPVYSLVATTIPSWHRLKTISALMSTTNFATLAAIGWLTLPSRAPTPPPPPGPPPPTDEGGPAAGSHRAAPSLDETSRRRGSGRAIVPTNPPAQQRRPSWGSNLGLVPGQCAPPARPPAPFSAHRVTCDALSLSSPQSPELPPALSPARAHRARAAAHHTRAAPRAGDPTRNVRVRPAPMLDDSPSSGGRTSNTLPPIQPRSAGAFDPNASAAAPAPALGLDAPARTASDIPPAAVVLPPATPPDAGARAAPRSSHTPGGRIHAPSCSELGAVSMPAGN